MITEIDKYFFNTFFLIQNYFLFLMFLKQIKKSVILRLNPCYLCAIFAVNRVFNDSEFNREEKDGKKRIICS